MIPNQWYGILASKQVKRGQVVGAVRCGLRLALFRAKDGTLGCVEDLCPHRGAALSCGKLTEGGLQCPFHGLQFLPDGKCSFVPALGKASTEDLTRFHVRSYPVREAHGMIYLWYGEGEPDLAAPLPFFDEYIDAGFSRSLFWDHWNGHYSRCIENQLDVVHLPFVHHNTIGRGHKTVVNGPAVLMEYDFLRTSADNAQDVGQAPKPPEECAVGETLFLGFRFPNVWMNHIAPGYKLVIFFAPVDEENTVLYIFTYTKFTPLRALNRIAAWASKPMAYIIERQDRRVVTTQRPKPSSFFGKEQLLVGDRPIVLYRKRRDELQRAAEQKQP